MKLLKLYSNVAKSYATVPYLVGWIQGAEISVHSMTNNRPSCKKKL